MNERPFQAVVAEALGGLREGKRGQSRHGLQ